MTKEKKVFVELEDGRLYSIPAKVVADNRAQYYADKDPDTTYKEEFEFTMENEEELTDWIQNNMNWYEHDPKLELEGEMPDLSQAQIEDIYTGEE